MANPSDDQDMRGPAEPTRGSASNGASRNGASRNGHRPRALVVDDDEPQLAALVQILRDDARLGQILTAVTGAEALLLALRHRPTGVFLATRLPDVSPKDLHSGLDCLSPSPAVVWVSESSAAAVDAFGLGAVDYLVKPLSPDRVAQSIDRLLASGATGDRRRGGDRRTSAATQEHLIAVNGTVDGASRLIPLASVVFAQAAGERVELTCDDGVHALASTLHELEREWGPRGFERVHRSFLVNVRRINELQPSVGGAVLVLADGSKVPVARRQLPALKRRLGLERV